MNQPRVEILLAEDSLSDAEFIVESLIATGRSGRVHVVHDGEEALDFLFCRAGYVGRAGEMPPRLILLDLKLPEVSGLDVLRALKSDSRTQPIPVVMLTSSNIDRDVADGYRLGANSYVQKPVDFERFRETVRLLELYWLSANEPLPRAGLAAAGTR